MNKKVRVQFFSFGFQGGKFLDFYLELQSHLRNPPPDSFSTWIWAWISVHQMVLLSPFLSMSSVAWHPQSLWAHFIEVPSWFHSVTFGTGWKGAVSVRWEKLFKTECLYPGKIQPLFLFCASPPERQETEECIQKQCRKFVSLETRDPAWMNRSTSLAWKDCIKKNLAKLK